GRPGGQHLFRRDPVAVRAGGADLLQQLALAPAGFEGIDLHRGVVAPRRRLRADRLPRRLPSEGLLGRPPHPPPRRRNPGTSPIAPAAAKAQPHEASGTAPAVAGMRAGSAVAGLTGLTSPLTTGGPSGAAGPAGAGTGVLNQSQNSNMTSS